MQIHCSYLFLGLEFPNYFQGDYLYDFEKLLKSHLLQFHWPKKVGANLKLVF